jgi:hypothetical protein
MKTTLTKEELLRLLIKARDKKPLMCVEGIGDQKMTPIESLIEVLEDEED